MKNPSGNTYAKLSLISITLTAIITATHHVFRDGLGLLVPWGIIILLPYVLLRWFTQTRSTWPVWVYGYTHWNEGDYSHEKGTLATYTYVY